MADGADVLRHVFTVLAIAPRRSLNQYAVFVAQVHRQAIKFQLGDILDRWVGVGQRQLFADAGVKGLRTAGLGIGFGADAEHGYGMAHAGEGVQRLATNALRGGVRGQQRGVGSFQRLQFAKQPVVLGVGDCRIVQHIVAVGVVVQLLVECFYSDSALWRRHRRLGYLRMREQDRVFN